MRSVGLINKNINMSGVKEGWVDILNDVDDVGVMLLMNDHNIYVDEHNYLVVGEKSHIASTQLLNRITRLREKKILIEREKNLDKLL